MRSCLFLLPLIICCFATKTLVLVDDLSIQQTHSAFLSSLTARGHDVTIRHVYNEENKLGSYGEWSYDNLVLFCPTAEDMGEIKVSTIVSFVDAGKNVLLAVNEHVTEPLRELANELGVDFDQEKTMVIDHVNYDHSLDTEMGGLHTVVFNRPAVHAPVLLGGSEAGRSVLFRGVGHAAQESPLVIRVLTGSPTAFSADPTKPVQEIQSGGTDTLLVSAIQTRGNARIVVSGSLDLFSDRFFFAEVNDGQKKGKSGNQQFGIELSKWNFHERGLLRARHLEHHRHGESHAPANYRVKDNIDFSVILEIRWQCKGMGSIQAK
jgi:oligosaccharyltransferase complex subunit beta